ncbi:MAG: glycosyltransferase family 2 protein [Deltaproteobacteria bacterium]|nr:glycosyltransferase family 2 protein [Deltaproteobacteria bacterium]
MYSEKASQIITKTFTPPHPLKTVVLFLIFNRSDTTKQVFEAIRQAKPPRLYVAADGQRVDKPGEAEKCEEVRRIATQVDWDCEVKTLFRDKNLGCKYAVSGAIDWFFENEEEGIILEDDCLPSQSFFWFCEELLERYLGDERVMQICGSNFLNGWLRNDDSYYFSQYGPVWGWASWRRAWIYYDVDMKLWPEVKEKKIFLDFCDGKSEMSYRLNLYDKVFAGEIDTWDYQWGFAKIINHGLSVTPNANLISNIGFREDGTHVANGNSPFANMQALSVHFPLSHPKFVCRDRISDQRYLKNFVNRGTLNFFLCKLLSIGKRLAI